LSRDKQASSPRGELSPVQPVEPTPAQILLIRVPGLINLSRDKQANSPRGELEGSSTG